MKVENLVKEYVGYKATPLQGYVALLELFGGNWYDETVEEWFDLMEIGQADPNYQALLDILEETLYAYIELFPYEVEYLEYFFEGMSLEDIRWQVLLNNVDARYEYYGHREDIRAAYYS